MKDLRKEFKRVVGKVKGEVWGKYLEEVDVNEAFKWIKMDRDFVVDVPGIRGEGGDSELCYYESEEGELLSPALPTSKGQLHLLHEINENSPPPSSWVWGNPESANGKLVTIANTNLIYPKRSE